MLLCDAFFSFRKASYGHFQKDSGADAPPKPSMVRSAKSYKIDKIVPGNKGSAQNLSYERGREEIEHSFYGDDDSA